ncbi:MAG: hypothetical protein JO316_19820 [Abitibacteriaceae bacterium]|nr:hypothetical protein [Abditibacteriaceae bacterium]
MRRCALMVIWMVVLLGGIRPLLAAPAEVRNGALISEITMQKIPGGPRRADDPEDKIVLNLDEDRSSADAVRFGQLAQWLIKKGFFQLKDKYYDENAPGDCGGIILSAVRGGQRKTVISTCGAGDQEVFWEIEMVIRGVATQMQKQQQGQRGPEGNRHKMGAEK